MTADDWLVAAASRARHHISDGLRSRFGSKGWNEFDDRLNRHFEHLFRLLHRLYGWQYDFAWTVESLVVVAANGYLERPKKLRRADRRNAGGAPAWITDQATTWVVARPDRLLGDPQRQVGHLRALGVTHVQAMASDASLEEMKMLASILAEAGIEMVLDLVCDHTTFDHPWAQSAASGGSEADFYFFYPNRALPDRFTPFLREAFPERGGDAFTWHPEVQGGSWVWTTFNHDQWDLDYSNPRVLAAMASELLSIANLGAGVIRLNGTPHLWKSMGTACEHLPEAHVVVQVLRVLADIAAPSVTFVSGAKVGADLIPEYVNPEECRLGYDSLLMSSIWEALATSDTRLLRIAVGRQGGLAPGCTTLRYLRDTDFVDWSFDDVAAVGLGIDPVLHRQYLNSFYDVKGSIASLSGLETAQEEMDPALVDLAIRRITVAWAVVISSGGIPLLSATDEPELPNDLSAESQVLTGLKRLLAARRALTGVDTTTPAEPIETGDNGVVAYRRGRSLLAANLTARSTLVVRDFLPPGEYFDLIAEETWDSHVLGPYEYRFVRL